MPIRIMLINNFGPRRLSSSKHCATISANRVGSNFEIAFAKSGRCQGAKNLLCASLSVLFPFSLRPGAGGKWRARRPRQSPSGWSIFIRHLTLRHAMVRNNAERGGTQVTIRTAHDRRLAPELADILRWIRAFGVSIFPFFILLRAGLLRLPLLRHYPLHYKPSAACPLIFFIMGLSNCHLNGSDYNNDALIGTVHYARTGDYVSAHLIVD